MTCVIARFNFNLLCYISAIPKTVWFHGEKEVCSMCMNEELMGRQIKWDQGKGATKNNISKVIWIPKPPFLSHFGFVRVNKKKDRSCSFFNIVTCKCVAVSGEKYNIPSSYIFWGAFNIWGDSGKLKNDGNLKNDSIILRDMRIMLHCSFCCI